METWKWIEGFEDRYEISNFGRIRSYMCGSNPHIIKVHADSRGYIHVVLYGENGRKNLWVHRLVAKAFVPNPSFRKEVNHKDGDKSNIAAANLEWVSRSQNIRHAYENGLIPTVGQKGARNHNTKLTDDMVREMRRLYAEREITQKELAAKFGVTKLTAYRILNRHCWTHI